MPGKEKNKAERGHYARHAEPGGFELHVGPDNPADKQDGCEERDPLCENLEAGGRNFNHSIRIQPRSRAETFDVFGNPGGQQGLAPGNLHGLLGTQSEEGPFRIDDLVTHLDFLVEVHEAVHEFGMVAVEFCHAAEIPGVVGDYLRIHGRRDFLPGAGHRGRSADRAYRCHVDLLCPQRDQCARRAGIGIHVGVDRNRAFHQHLDDVLGRLERSPRGVHVQNQGGGPRRFRLFQDPAQKKKLRFGDHPLDREHHNSSFFNLLFRRLQRQDGGEDEKKKSHRLWNLPRADPARKVISACGTDIRGDNPARGRGK